MLSRHRRAWRFAGRVAVCLTVAACLAVSAFTCSSVLAGSAPPGDLTFDSVSFRNANVTLHGTVVATKSVRGRQPGIVLVGGSGPRPRTDYLQEAEAFARGGVVTLIYDKRTVGYSLTHRDYSLLAGDALAAVQVLRARGDVDPTRVGLWGESEGSWVASLAASRSRRVAYVVLVGLSGVPGARQTGWYYGNLLRRDGVSGSMLRAIPVTGVRQLVGAGLFPEANYDPRPSLEQLRQPVLAIWSTRDDNHPPEESSRILLQALDRGGNRHYTIRFIGDSDPGLHRSADGFTHQGGLAPGYPGLVTSWVRGLARGVPAASVQPAPRQVRLSASLPPLAWWESTPCQLAALGLLVVGFAGYLALAAVRRMRARDRRWRRSPAAPVLAGAGLGTTLGFAAYFFVVMLMLKPGPVLAGRALPWLALQIFAVAAVVAMLPAVAAGWRHRREVNVIERVQLGLLYLGGLVLVPWALYWGLLTP